MTEQRVLVQQSPVQITPFSGSDKESYTQFENQLDSSIKYAQVAENARVQFLHLHLKGGALMFFDQMADKNDFTAVKGRLKDRYASNKRGELHKLAFEGRKFKPSEESVEDYLTDIQRLGLLAYPDTEALRIARVKEVFAKGMPNRIRRRLLTTVTKDPGTTVDTLCEEAARLCFIDAICPDDEDTAFNEVDQEEKQQQQPVNDELANFLTSMQKDMGAIAQMLESQVSLKDEPEKPEQTYKEDYRSRPSSRTREGYDRNFSRSASPGYQRGYRGREYQGGDYRSPERRSFSRGRGFSRGAGRGFSNDRGRGSYNNYQGRGSYNNSGRGSYSNEGRGSSNNRGRGFTNAGRIICRNCGKPGHMQRDCWSRPEPQRNSQLPYKQADRNQKN